MPEIYNYRAWLDAKHEIIEKHLKPNPPTVVVSRPEGVYVLGQQVKPINSTMILAGAGQSFFGVESWFRGQINLLNLEWDFNVPRAKSEVNLLSYLFELNLRASDEALHAEVALVEIGAERDKDSVYHVDYLGNVKEAIGSEIEVWSFKHREKKDPEENEDVQEESVQSGTSGFPRIGRGILRELETLGLSGEALLNLTDADSVRRFAQKYPRAAWFMSREKFKAKEHDWICEPLK